jgi:hypothetical protein
VLGYNVYEGTAPGGESATPVNGGTLVGPTTTSYTVTGLSSGTTYYFTVAAVNAVGSSPASTEVAGSSFKSPAPPTGLAAVSGLAQVALSWSAPASDGGSPVLGYNVYEGTAPGGESATPVNGGTLINPTTTSYTLTGVTSGTTYYFTVEAVNAVGSSPASNEASARPGPPLNWNAAGSAEPPMENWTAISCPTSSFCAAVGGSSGDAAIYQGGSWSRPMHFSTGSIGLVSCASSSLCVAVDQSSSAVFDYNGSADGWSQDGGQPSAPTPLVAVSCASGPDRFCMLVDSQGDTYTRSNGGAWSAGGNLPADLSLEGLSCLSSTSCVALMAGLDNFDNVTSYTAYGWNGSAWSTGGSLPSLVISHGDSVQGFSCSAVTACVALLSDPMTSSNVLYTYDGAAWSGASLPGGFNPQRPVACAAGSNCFVTGTSANSGSAFFMYSGGAWSAVPNGTQGAFKVSAFAMSCGSAAFCATVPGDNSLDVFDNATWTLSPVGGTNQVQAVSCATSSFCAAVDNGGNYVTYNGTAWSMPAAVNAQCAGANSCPHFFGTGAITCPSVGQCAAIDSSGNVWRYAAQAWSSAHVLDSPLPQGGISCTAAGFCAVASGMQVATYTNGMWTAVTKDNVNKDLDSVACTGADFCLAVDRLGQYTMWDGMNWSPMATLDSHAASSLSELPESVACASSSLCVAAGGDGYAEVYQGNGWSTPNPLAGGGANALIGASCVPASGSQLAYCVVGANRAVYYLDVEGSAPTWTTAQAVPTNNADSILALGCGPAVCAATGVQNYAWLGTS